MRAWRSVQRSTLKLDHLHRRTYSHSRVPHGLSIADVLQSGKDAENIEVSGWVRSVRKQKRVAFAAISDGSTIDAVQAVLKPEDAAELSTGSAVQLKGDWKASAGSKQSHELQVTRMKVLGGNDAESNPLQPKHQTEEYLRTLPHLRPRTPANALLLRLRSQLIASITKFFNDRDFVQTHTPIITSSDCEGAGEVFTVSARASEAGGASSTEKASKSPIDHFFREPKYLTVSAQLHLEALAQAVTKVWTLSPTFRAEQSDTPRHLSEFYMLEAETCFVHDLHQVMDLVESMLRSAVIALKDSRLWEELLKSKQKTAQQKSETTEHFVTAENLKQRWDGLCERSWPRIAYSEAMELLRSAHETDNGKFAFRPSYDNGLQAEHERYIASFVGGNKPVFVTDYPSAQKPFYMAPSSTTATHNESQATVACFDLLVPDFCELAGGSLREHRSEELLRATKEKNVAGKDLDWYQDLRKYGSVPHGGFGLGFDRLLCYLGGVNNVRDVVAFPRWHGRCLC